LQNVFFSSLALVHFFSELSEEEQDKVVDSLKGPGGLTGSDLFRTVLVAKALAHLMKQPSRSELRMEEVPTWLSVSGKGSVPSIHVIPDLLGEGLGEEKAPLSPLPKKRMDGEETQALMRELASKYPELLKTYQEEIKFLGYGTQMKGERAVVLKASRGNAILLDASYETLTSKERLALVFLHLTSLLTALSSPDEGQKHVQV